MTRAAQPTDSDSGGRITQEFQAMQLDTTDAKAAM
jgi:hypothetical protein